MIRKPNIILFITDQQRADTINALGTPWMKTPVLDKLVGEGAAFTKCYVTTDGLRRRVAPQSLRVPPACGRLPIRGLVRVIGLRLLRDASKLPVVTVN